MSSKYPQFFSVTEFELKDSAPSVFGCVEEILRKIISSGLLYKAVVINSRFLRNARSYRFEPGSHLFLSNEELELRLSDIVSSCVDKGHFSCILALNEIPDDGYFCNFEKSASKVDFFSGVESESPLSNEQREEFIGCVNKLGEEGRVVLVCFSHDAEFIYVLKDCSG